MYVTRSASWAMLLITVLWAATPAIACLVPMHQMTKAEHDCCLKMAQECGSSMMPSSHSCCQGHDRDNAVSPVATYSPTRPFDVATVRQTAILLATSSSVPLKSLALEAPPPEASPGCSSILRI
jgi:Na+(H+)/acetate symporter ActP